MTKEKAEIIERMIKKECQRYSLVELCASWGITTDDFDEFLECAWRYIDLSE